MWNLCCMVWFFFAILSSLCFPFFPIFSHYTYPIQLFFDSVLISYLLQPPLQLYADFYFTQIVQYIDK